MTIVRKGTPVVVGDSPDRAGMGEWAEVRYSDAGGLTQFGAHVVTLQPGSRSSDRHWHEAEDEFLYVLEGEAVVVEEDGEHAIGPGDAACWRAGEANAHCVLNRSATPCTFLVVGTRAEREVQRYPDLGRTTYIDGKAWRVTDDRSGEVLRQGRDD
jgi:uncharacterized cupin superfamily protein